MQITTIGLDLAKNVLQVHGIDAEGAVVVRRALRRKAVLLFLNVGLLAWSGLKPAALGS